MKVFGNHSNPKEGIWNCNGCLMSNKFDALNCPASGTLKPGVIKEGIKAAGHPQKKDGENGFGDYLFKHKDGSWKCDGCLCSNNSDILMYPVCDIMKQCDKNLKEDLPKEKGKASVFGSNAGGFNFGGKSGFTFGTDGESNTKAVSEFTFPTPDLAKKKSELNPPFTVFSFTSIKSDAKRKTPDVALKGFKFTVPPCVTSEQSTESHQPIDGPSPGAHTAGTVSSPSSNLTTLPLVCSLQSASTSPDKPLANPVSMVTTNAPGSSAPKGIFRFGQQPVTSGTQSTFSFGHVPFLNPGAGKNISPSSTKASTTILGAVGNICIFPQKKNIIACKSSKETSLVTSPLKISDNSVLRGKKPVIDLPDVVETKNGEEEGETVFCEKATLLRFDDGFWKERGSGELQLLRHKQTKRVQLLMRQDQVLNIYAKHFLTKEMKLYPLKSSKMTWGWIAEDLSEGEVKIQYFVVCFKDEDLALKFKATFEILQSELQQVKSNQVQKEPVKKGTFGSTSDISEIQTKPVVQDKPSVPQPEVVQEVKPEMKPDSGPQKLQYTNDDVKDLAKHLFWEVIGDMAKEVSEDLLQGAMMISNGTQDVCDIIVEEVVTEYVGDARWSRTWPFNQINEDCNR